MFKSLHKHNKIAIFVPILLSPLAYYLSHLNREKFLFGLSSDFWGGFQIGLSIVVVSVGLITMLVKRKPK